jgi:hypothetical protein
MPYASIDAEAGDTHFGKKMIRLIHAIIIMLYY